MFATNMPCSTGSAALWLRCSEPIYLRTLCLLNTANEAALPLMGQHPSDVCMQICLHISEQTHTRSHTQSARSDSRHSACRHVCACASIRRGSLEISHVHSHTHTHIRRRRKRFVQQNFNNSPNECSMLCAVRRACMRICVNMCTNRSVMECAPVAVPVTE